jgi:hypothetical protein
MSDEQEECPASVSITQDEDEEWVDPPPECPYNCPYDPMNPQRPEYVDSTIESDIVAQRPEIRSEIDSSESQVSEGEVMTAIIRQTRSEAEVHFQNVWQTNWGTKVGVKSKPEYSDIFSEELEWDVAHQKWNTDRVQDTEMWEIDASAVFYVASVFSIRDIDLTIDDEVHTAYIEAVED